VIVIDDGSTDGSLDVIRKFDKRIHWETQPNQGACAARNRGMQIASGDYLQFLDADDELFPEKIAHQMAMVEDAGPGLAFVAGAYVYRRLDKRDRRFSPLSDDPWLALIRGDGALGITSSNLWRAKSLQAVGGWNTEWQSSQETELMFRLLRNGTQIAYDEKTLTIVHQQRDSLSRSRSHARFKPAAWRNWLKLRSHIVTFLKSKGELTAKRRDQFQMKVIELVRGYWHQDQKEASKAFEKYMAGGRLRLSRKRLAYRVTFNLGGFRFAEACRSRYRIW
jgi:glycosyltransferase involved in cell wall biosynthesis